MKAITISILIITIITIYKTELNSEEIKNNNSIKYHKYRIPFRLNFQKSKNKQYYIPKCKSTRRVKRSEINNSTKNIAYLVAKQDRNNLINDYSNHTENDLRDKHRALISLFKKLWPVQHWHQYGLFTDDYLEILNEHWLQFPPPSKTVHYALGGFYIVFLTVGLCGNLLVLVMYIRCRSLRTPGNILVANLAFSDFLMLAKTPIFIFNSFNLGPALGKTGCTIYGFIGGLTGTTSITTLAAISLDRYWAVVHPLEHLCSLTTFRARIIAVITWLYASVFASVPALDIGYGRYVPEGYLTSCSFDYLTNDLPPRYFIFFFFCAAWLAPFCTISFCYLNIIRAVIYNRNITIKNQEQRLSTRHLKENVKSKKEIKLSVLVVAVIALFFISWTPYAIVSLLGIFGKKELITPIISMVPALFCKTSACINPFVYLINHPNFRKELNKIILKDHPRLKRETINIICNSIDSIKQNRQSEYFNTTDVEIIELRDIPIHNSDKLNKYNKY